MNNTSFPLDGLNLREMGMSVKQKEAFKLRQPDSEAVGPMKPLRGPTQTAGEK